MPILHITDHLDAFHLESRAMDPSSRLAQTRPRLAGLTLQEKDLACGRGRLRLHARDTAAGHRRVTDTPLAQPSIAIQGDRVTIVHEKLSHIETDATGSNDRHSRTDRSLTRENVEVAANLRMILPRNFRIARHHTRGKNDFVETSADQRFGADALTQSDVNVGCD